MAITLLAQKILDHIQSLNKISVTEAYASDVDYQDINAMLDNEIDHDEVARRHFDKCGTPVTEWMLDQLETESLAFDTMPGLSDYQALDGYYSSHFKVNGLEYYLFNNHDAGFSEADENPQVLKTLLTDILLFSAEEQCFYVFMVTCDEHQYQVAHFQKSDCLPDLLPLIRERQLFGKRSYYWYPSEQVVDIRCPAATLSALNKVSPEKYQEWASGDRLRIHLQPVAADAISLPRQEQQEFNSGNDYAVCR